MFRGPLELPRYVSRDVDGLLSERIRRGGFFVLVGDSTAGKSRTAVEALRRVHPESMLVAPLTRDALPTAVAWARLHRNCVLWLDDLERFLGPGGGLTPQQIAGLVLGDDKVLVLATLRAEERARLFAIGSDDSAELRSLAREVGPVLRLAEFIRIDRRFTGGEVQRAEVTANDDPRIAAALTYGDRYGPAEYLAAGPVLLDRWQDGWAPGQSPRGAALVSA